MKKLFALFIAALMLFAFAACGTPEQESSAPETAEESASEYGPVLSKIMENGKLVVGTEAQYAPFEFKDLDANYAGCDMWLAGQIADALGVELEIVDMAFDGIIPAVQAGQVDMGIAAFTKTDERAEVIDFTKVYQQDWQLLIVKAGNEDVYTTVESLAGLQVGAQKGTIQSKLIQSALPDSALFELEKYPSLALEVANGNIAGLVVDGAVGEAMVASNGQLAVANFTFDPTVAQFGKAIVIQQGNGDLVAATNAVIDEVLADGSFAAAYEEAKALAQQLGL